MTADGVRVLFMGTPDFAVSSLKSLDETGLYDISVVTQPDKPKGRGYGISESDVKKYAVSRGIPVYQPVTLKDGAFESTLREIDPEVVVVAAYGKILPDYLLGYPRSGCVNVHGSLLPEYRGAAPIQRALIDGKTVTGITIMKMDAGLDTGDILFTKRVDILPEDDAGSLFDKMAAAGGELIREALPLILCGKAVPVPQDGSLATYAPKIGKNECLIDTSRPADSVFCLIRGLSPSPLAYFVRRNGDTVKINKAAISDREYDLEPGTIVPAEDGIDLVCGDGRAVRALCVTPAGKRKMSASDYIRGHRIDAGGEPTVRDV